MLALTGAGNSNDIGVVALTDEQPEITWILNSRFSESDPAISPDGRWMAYTSNESGQVEVYVRQFPSGSGRWQVSNGGGGFPRWAATGRELVYRSSEGLMVATIEPTGESLRTGTPEQLFTGQFVGGVNGMATGSYVFNDYDIAPDGSRFVMFPRAADTQSATAGILTLVSNWFDDMARLK